MGLIASFLFNALANFALGLLLARHLGPAAFGAYAVAMAGAGALAAPALDWLRHAATRFYSDETRRGALEVRATLDAAAAAVTLVLLALAPVAGAVARGAGQDPIVAILAVLFCTAGALFDFAAALMRARFMQRDYVALVLAKSALTVVPMVALSAVAPDPAPVLAAGLAGQALCLVLARRRLADPGTHLSLARMDLARRYAAYGVPLMFAGGLAMIQAFFNRSALAAAFGIEDAGRFSLAYDIGIRIVAVSTMALDVLLFQLAVRTEHQQGREAALGQLSANIAVVAALLTAVAGGYALVIRPFEAVFVAEAFRGAFAAHSLALVPGLAAWALMQYAVSPAFQIRGSTTPMALPYAVALASNIALAWILPGQWGPIGFSLSFSGGMIVGLAVAILLAGRLAPVAVPWRDLALVAAAGAAMAAAISAARAVLPPAWEASLPGLIVEVAAGGGSYAAVILATGAAGLRARLSSLNRSPAPASPKA